MRPNESVTAGGRRRTRGAVGVGPLVLLLVLVGCGSSTPEAPAGALPRPTDLEDTTGASELHPVPVADLGETATALAAHPDGEWMLAGRRSGAVFPIRLVPDGDFLVPEVGIDPVLDLSGTVTTDGERGLFDLTFSPDGTDLYASYTDPDGAVTVARFPFDATRGTIEADDPAILARVDHPFAGHNAGDLEWLDDHTLLWSLGDMDLTTTDPPAAQDLTNPLGSIVRLDVDEVGAEPLTGPDLVGDHTVAVGLRNPWRIHLDEATGTLLIGDVGDDRFEEIDAMAIGPVGAEPPNFGWPWFEGDEATDLAPDDLGDGFVEPLLSRGHAEDVCAIVAGVSVPRALSSVLGGDFLFGDNCSGEVQALSLDDAATAAVAEIDDGVVAFAAGTHDDVYVLGLSGGVWRLDPAGWEIDPPAVPTLPAPPTSEDDATATLAPDQFQAVCDVRTAFALLEAVTGADPATFEADLEEATTIFEDAVDDLPDAVDPTSFRAVFAAAAAVGRSTGWDTTSPAFTALFRAVTAADPPYADFPEAMAVLVDLGAAC